MITRKEMATRCTASRSEHLIEHTSLGSQMPHRVTRIVTWTLSFGGFVVSRETFKEALRALHQLVIMSKGGPGGQASQ